MASKKKVEKKEVEVPTKILLMTMPHSGTHFFAEMFRDYGFDVKMLHCTDDWARNIEKAKVHWADKVVEGKMVIVTTIRNERDMMKAFTARKKDANMVYTYQRWWQQFVDEMKPHVVSIDHNDRDKMIEDLGRAVGKSFNPDWDNIVNPDPEPNAEEQVAMIVDPISGEKGPASGYNPPES